MAVEVALDGLEPEFEGVDLAEEARVIPPVKLTRIERHGFGLARYGRSGLWYSSPIRASRVLNSFRTVSARTASISLASALERSVPCQTWLFGAAPARLACSCTTRRASRIAEA